MTMAISPAPRIRFWHLNRWGTAILLWLLCAIALASAIARLYLMQQGLAGGALPDDPSELPYIEHPIVALMHVLPGMAFVTLGPLQFVTHLRAARPRLHRLSGRVFVVSTVVMGVTAMGMAATFPGLNSVMVSTGFFFFGFVQVALVAIAMRHIFRRDVPAHRRWMIRTFAIGSSVATMRISISLAMVVLGDPEPYWVAPMVIASFVFNAAVGEVLARRSGRSSPVAIPAGDDATRA